MMKIDCRYNHNKIDGRKQFWSAKINHKVLLRRPCAEVFDCGSFLKLI